MFSEFLLLICQLTPEKASTQTKLKMATHRDKTKVERGTSHKSNLDRCESDLEDFKI